MKIMNHSSCLACGHKSSNVSFFSALLCAKCAKGIPWITKYDCPHCGRMQACADCTKRIRENEQFLTKNRSAVQYTSAMKKWLATYKFRGDERWASILADMMWLTWQAQFDIPIDVITYVPSSRERTLERSFNQSERLAMLLSQRSNIPVMPLLIRAQHSDKQSTKNRKERLLIASTEFRFNLKTIDEWSRRFSSLQKNRSVHILIVDDVYTTGTTLHTCVQSLLKHTDASCFGLTWARS
jgi:competence protein ComFC